MTDTNQRIKAFVKTLEEAGIITTNTSGLTSTRKPRTPSNCLLRLSAALHLSMLTHY